MASDEENASLAAVLGPPKEFSEKELADIRETLRKTDTVTLRALVRQSSHQIENGSQRYFLAPEETTLRMGRAINVLRIALQVWEGRDRVTGQPDIDYAHRLLDYGEQFQKNPDYHPHTPHEPFSQSDLRAVEKVITERRAVRRFSDKEVPDGAVEKVIEAAIWAPGTCSLQANRFFVLEDIKTRNLIIQPWNAPVVIVVGQDTRPYELTRGVELPYNRFIDLGAAIQNLLLMAHALGLGTCVGTFTGELQRVRRALAVPDYIEIMTYIVLGWPQDRPPAMPRMELKEFISRERWA